MILKALKKEIYLRLVICNSVAPEKMSAPKKDLDWTKLVFNCNSSHMKWLSVMDISSKKRKEFGWHLKRVRCSAEVQRLEDGDVIGTPSSWIRCSIAWNCISGKFAEPENCISVNFAEPKNWISRNLSEPGNWISGNFAEPKNWISGNFAEPGNWISGNFTEPGNWISGNYEEPRNWISRNFAEPGNWISGNFQSL